MSDAAAALLAAVLAGASPGCGASAPPEVGGDTVRATRGPVDLTLVDVDGRVVEVRAFRGRPVLLYLFATFDGGSQAALTPLSSFVQEHPEVAVLGVAVQPNARTFADAWASALTPPFPVTWEPSETIPEGTSGLGRLEGIPTFVGLDADGRIVGRHVGVPTVRALEALLPER